MPVPTRDTDMKFIFEVHIKPGHSAEEYADAWVRASKIMQRAPGARGTLLHRMIGDPRMPHCNRELGLESGT